MNATKKCPRSTGFLIATILAFLLFGGCAYGPEVKSVRKSPDVSQSPRNLLVLAISSDEEIRAVMEKALVARLKNAGYQAEAYGPVTSMPWDDPESLQKRVQQRGQPQGADGVLTVSLVNKKKQVDHIPGQVVFNPVETSIGPLASVTYMETMVIPERFEESTRYVLRTTLFDSESGDSIWQMFSSTVDPKSLEQATSEFSRVVVRELQKSFTE
ncbi:hypothetical protein [Marinobacter changyiensis]|uniref:hypothetical protein n=1 Tax=Marinobacter changyiensis TaxID=2604091 RepID=UPI0012651743|nr:hypothetical protein [Marinobacter changyiensis]